MVKNFPFFLDQEAEKSYQVFPTGTRLPGGHDSEDEDKPLKLHSKTNFYQACSVFLCHFKMFPGPALFLLFLEFNNNLTCK